MIYMFSTTYLNICMRTTFCICLCFVSSCVLYIFYLFSFPKKVFNYYFFPPLSYGKVKVMCTLS
ncbi:hypothetical protein BDZ91DRAFT_743353 [Kalaharituber pfeilii]|nr:hypothetical protein BDZ91DRAFT_743353 [Kalaharituber pfeilii]